MSKQEKPAEGAAEEGAAKPNSKKKLLLIVGGVLVLALGGGAGWYFTKGSHPAEAKAPPPLPPKFIALEPFTVNLQNDGSDQYLQIGISLKFTAPELEEELKLHMPEIRSRLLFLLSSKHAAELGPMDGKKKLVKEIIAETNSVLGIRTLPAKAHAPAEHAAEAAPAAEGEAAASETPATEEAAPPPAHGEKEKKAGILDVLFTSFIIQ